MPLRSPSDSDLESYKSEQPLLSPGKSNPAEKSSSAGHRPPTAAFPDEPLRPKAGAAAMGVAALLVAGYLLLGKRHVSSSWHTSHVFPRVGGVTGTSYQREGGHDPGGFALCRQLIGALLMAALGYCREGSSIFALRRSDHRAIAKLGVFHYLNSVLFIWGFKLSTPFFASVAQLSIPVMTFVYTALAGRLPAGSAHHEHAPAAGAAAGAAGSGSPPVPASLWVGAGFLPLQSASCLSWGLTWRRGTDRVGVGCLALQTGSFSGLLVLQKALVQAYPVALVVAWGYSAGAVLALIGSVFDGSIHTLPANFNSPSLMGILFFHTPVRLLELCGYAVAMLGVAAMASVVIQEGDDAAHAPNDRVLDSRTTSPSDREDDG
ncbi:hypothetical protein EMIHUDRAFT_470210 [Emiliania huxleyi CCMP1516]|uniref:EamA domain-containing protein n=2 Tax=Emiliania huxleyi TaxID=2903 RepID=A0A0D3J573_EMIH1|nr:hypothetical protein EMIHUDRAFT_470210 [Emiliania huxleyi CCMP1516]EOD18658.1 hypothetical protein EMIHUDRAFT_470210 [Emiliania huxleyi CCMP1516]|eukprot:XP_005771087.1 hypothetical protein EMIHUDRAFT_470210 [Emiliania huxleyi CCMP1516]